MSAVHAAYRDLFRAVRITFRGDERMLTAAKTRIRDGFRANSTLTENSSALDEARGVAAFLRQNLVQGKKIGDDRYQLNIHEDTERGDNDTIKVAGKSISPDGTIKCCSS
ncbi:mitochondrial zinc maintenance protein 1, mitochondrial [Xylariaceae sp. FL0255]|nr:mitochondrial zinc maintenance protein 1, mitochondrial [Xylariaceae sp. FL0255]